MGKIWMPGGGGGVDLDVVTAASGDVLADKVIFGADGEPLTGTMTNRGAVNTEIEINGTYTIPDGYHNGYGQVTQSIPTFDALTIIPGTSAQIVSTSGKYGTGDITVNAVSNLSAANIKKGVIVGGVEGSWEGYVADETDLYYKGANLAGFANYLSNSETDIKFESTYISLSSSSTDPQAIQILAEKTYEFAGYSNLNIRFYIEKWPSVSENRTISLRKGTNQNSLKVFVISGSDGDIITYSFPLETLQTKVAPLFRLVLLNSTIQVQRIWLS